MSHITVVLPCGPGADQALDTISSIEHYLGANCPIVVVDDHTSDGTYDALVGAARPNWILMRNPYPRGIEGLIRSLADGFLLALERTQSDIILRLDQDALITNRGLPEAALEYAQANSVVGIFGVYREDYNRPRSFESHRSLINSELFGIRRLLRGMPFWAPILADAEKRGYRRGDNVFGGAYFITRTCLERLKSCGALDIPNIFRSQLMEDVYFSMATVAVDLEMGHFAAPDGPLCLEWRGLPKPAQDLWAEGFMIVHSVDKGHNTGPEENGGLSARAVFRQIRSHDIYGQNMPSQGVL
jgi:glycosyltransferase involved in cell wall biosynthesis